MTGYRDIRSMVQIPLNRRYHARYPPDRQGRRLERFDRRSSRRTPAKGGSRLAGGAGATAFQYHTEPVTGFGTVRGHSVTDSVERVGIVVKDIFGPDRPNYIRPLGEARKQSRSQCSARPDRMRQKSKIDLKFRSIINFGARLSRQQGERPTISNFRYDFVWNFQPAP